MFSVSLAALAAAHPVYFWLIVSVIILVLVLGLCGLGWFLYNYTLDNLELYDPEQPFHTQVTREIMPRSLLLARVLNFGRPVPRGTVLFRLQEHIDNRWRDDPELMKRWFEWLWQYGEEPVPTPPTKFQLFRTKVVSVFRAAIASVRPKPSEWNQFKERLRTKFTSSLSAAVAASPSFRHSVSALFDADADDLEKDLEKAIDISAPLPALVRGAAVTLPPTPRAVMLPAPVSPDVRSSPPPCSASSSSEDSCLDMSTILGTPPVPSIRITHLIPTGIPRQAYDAAHVTSPVLAGLTAKPQMGYLDVPEPIDEYAGDTTTETVVPRPPRRQSHAQRRPKAAIVETFSGPQPTPRIRTKSRTALAPVAETASNIVVPPRTLGAARIGTLRPNNPKTLCPARTQLKPAHHTQAAALRDKENQSTLSIPPRARSMKASTNTATVQTPAARRPWL